jgi:hypothetical protein
LEIKLHKINQLELEVEYLVVIKMALNKMHKLQPQIIIFLAQSQLQQASYKEEF